MRPRLLLAILVAALVAAAVVLVPTRASSPGSTVTPRTKPAAAPVGPPAATPPASSAPRPNVLLVMMDDMRWDELRYMPNTRKYIKDRGLSFANSFSPYPLCCPARTSFLLGEYAHNHHVFSVRKPYGFGAIDDSTTIATALRSSGYNTALVGKYLNLYGVSKSKVTGKSSVNYVPAGWTDWMAGLDTDWPTWSSNAGDTYNYFAMTQNVNGVVVPHHGTYSSTLVADETRGLISKYHRAGKPWFIFSAPVAPHIGNPVEPDDPLAYREARGWVQHFPTPARPDWVKGRFDARVTHAPGTPLHHEAEADVSDKPKNIRKWLPTTAIENQRLRDMQRQRAEALYAWDVEFKRIVQRLKRTHQYDDTIIMFTSDNGYYTGEHRQRMGKIKAHEPVIHTPFLMAGPGIPRGKRYSPITTMDLTATILETAQAQARLPRQDGRSFWPVVRSGDIPWSYPVVTEGLIDAVHHKTPGFRKGLTTIGLRMGRWKYTRYANGDRELYDLFKDPLELHSLQRKPRYASLMDQIDELWWQYKDCKGKACLVPLPEKLQVGPAQLKQQVLNERAERKAYYD